MKVILPLQQALRREVKSMTQTITTLSSIVNTYREGTGEDVAGPVHNAVSNTLSTSSMHTYTIFHIKALMISPWTTRVDSFTCDNLLQRIYLQQSTAIRRLRLHDASAINLIPRRMYVNEDVSATQIFKQYLHYITKRSFQYVQLFPLGHIIRFLFPV